MASFSIELKNEILFLDFYSPRAGNSLGLSDAEEISVALKRNKKARALVVHSSHERIFCSGGKLSDYAKMRDKKSGLAVNRKITAHLDFLAKWPGAKLALVNGDCYGGGMEWISSFDFRWTVPHALFCFWQRRIGLPPGWGGGRRWSELIGEKQLQQLLLSADVISSGQALHYGLVDRIVPSAHLFFEAGEWLQRVLDRGTYLPTRWSVKSAQRDFAKEWHSPQHRTVLENWK